jgi:hypothetical protein
MRPPPWSASSRRSATRGPGRRGQSIVRRSRDRRPRPRDRHAGRANPAVRLPGCTSSRCPRRRQTTLPPPQPELGFGKQPTRRSPFAGIVRIRSWGSLRFPDPQPLSLSLSASSSGSLFHRVDREPCDRAMRATNRVEGPIRGAVPLGGIANTDRVRSPGPRPGTRTTPGGACGWRTSRYRPASTPSGCSRRSFSSSSSTKRSRSSASRLATAGLQLPRMKKMITRNTT